MMRGQQIQTFWKPCALVVLAMQAFSPGCGSHASSNNSHNRNGKGSQAVTSEPVKVTTATVVAKDVPVTIRATGSFTAKESSDVSPQVPGQIIATPVNVGDTVKAGDIIARLDDRDALAKLQQASASLQQAQATAVNARAEAQRSAGLVTTGDISQSDYEKLTMQVDTANAQVAQAQSEVTLAKRALEETLVRAPFRGHVSDRPVAAGEYVTTASKVATIVQLQPIKLELQIPESNAAMITVGITVSAQVSSYAQREFLGRVTATNPALNPESRSLTVTAEFANKDLQLRPGMFATAEVRLAETEHATYVPQAAVFSPTGSTSSEVFVAEDGKAHLRVVQTGEAQGDLVRVISGAQEGERVITGNQDKLFDGQAIEMQ